MAQKNPFYKLYGALLDYLGAFLYRDVLRDAVEAGRRFLDSLSRYRVPNVGRESYGVRREELWDWYALDRVKDLLITGVQGDAESSGSRRGAISVTAEDFSTFFESLGLTVNVPDRFAPIHHEIVEVVTEEAARLSPRVDKVFWPGVYFGGLVVSRAGIRLRCAKDFVVKEIAEGSTLYFAFQRLKRPTLDLSAGCGGGSGWKTCFRRDYVADGRCFYNLDGAHALDPTIRQRESSELMGDLSVDERIELLTHRSFVRCPKRHDGRWPYDDSYEEPA